MRRGAFGDVGGPMSKTDDYIDENFLKGKKLPL